METVTAGIQMISLIVLSMITAIGMLGMRRWPDLRLLLLPPSIWAGAGVVFYLTLFAGFLSPEETLLWGAIHRLLGGLVVLGGMITLWGIKVGPRNGRD